MTGILVATIGAIATYTYNERKRTADQAHNERELAIQRIQTTQSFMPQLQSDDSRAVEAAILSISVLDARLATDLATLFQSPGAVTALSKIASSTDPAAAKRAEESLDRLFLSVRSAVVIVLNQENKPIGAGFLVSSKGYIFTPNYVLDFANEIRVKWGEHIYQVKLIKRVDEDGTALLKIEGDKFPSLTIVQPIKVVYQDKVFALIFDESIGWSLSSGQVIGLDVTMQQVAGQSFFATDLKSSRGSGGSPVVNANGQVIGAIYGMKDDRTVTIVLPVSPILRLIEGLQSLEQA